MLFLVGMQGQVCGRVIVVWGGVIFVCGGVVGGKVGIGVVSMIGVVFF